MLVPSHSGAANWGRGRGPGPPPKHHHKIFTDDEKYDTCPVNRKVKCITGSVFVFVSREAAILAQHVLETVWRLRPDPDPLGAHSAAPDSLAEFRGGRDGRENGRAKGGREGT